MTLETFKFDTAELLKTPELQAAFLADVFATGDQAEIHKALATVARARGMSTVAADASLSRQALYKSLSETADPRFSTIRSVLDALGMEMLVKMKEPKAA